MGSEGREKRKKEMKKKRTEKTENNFVMRFPQRHKGAIKREAMLMKMKD